MAQPYQDVVSGEQYRYALQNFVCTIHSSAPVFHPTSISSIEIMHLV